MKFAQAKFNKRSGLKCLVSMLLIAGAAANAGTASDPYQPDPYRLSERAGRSSDLYVDPYFNFSAHKEVTLDIAVSGADFTATANALLFVYAVSPNLQDDSPETAMDKSLLAIVKTDGTGKVYQTLEVSPQATTLLVQLHGVGGENQALVTLSDSPVVNLTFDQYAE